MADILLSNKPVVTTLLGTDLITLVIDPAGIPLVRLISFTDLIVKLSTLTFDSLKVGSSVQYESVVQTAGLITHAALGSATNIDITFTVKGTGRLNLPISGGGTYGYNVQVGDASFKFDTTGNQTAWSGAKIGWTAGAVSAALDTAFARNAAGVVEINNGTAGQYRDLRIRKILDTNGVQVLTTQGALVADASVLLSDVVAQFNTLLARLRAHGIIAT